MNNLTKRELGAYVGNMSQVAGCKTYTLNAGKAAGVKAIDVNNGTGLHFTILVDRGMDIAWADYKGINLSFISKTGIVAPQFYDSKADGFLESFGAGLLTTCGLTYMGAPCNDKGEELGMHGRIANVPAENCNINEYWKNDEYIIEIEGKVRQAKFFKENLLLTRKITTKIGCNSITIKDTIENCGFEDYPFMLLYHCNFGYPIVSEETTLITTKGSVRARDEEAQKGINTYNRFQKPTKDYKEHVFYHDFMPQDGERAVAMLYNEKLDGDGLGAYVAFNKDQLPYLLEWKQMGQSDYAVGLEPATWYPEGRDKARASGELIYIKAGEIKEFEIEIGVSKSRKI